ncbi:hypothetical protein DOY81_010382 [Sarcophaga bullata]|nr:hypothetical protein DOY81_010382 [Sarcophaga bullata]
MLHPKFMYLANLPRSHQNYSNFILHQPVDWYSEKGYPKTLPKYFYPQKVAGVGESVGLSIVLDVQQDQYYCSSSNSVGFKIALHSPNESPNVRETGLFIENGKETKLRVRPVKTESEPHLRSIHKKYRHCLFHDEGNLKFFAHYTQRNCEMECVAGITHKYCGCVSFFMPRTNGNISVCNIYDANCERKVLLRMDNSIKSCLDECLPSCYDLNFEADSFSTKLSHNGFDIVNTRIMNLSHSYVEENLAVVHIYFKENSFRSSMQTEFVGISDFLSSIGGLMGLFLGFSFVSIAELIYFAIIRPYRAIRQFRKSKDLYNRLETGTQMHSGQTKSKALRKSNKKRANKSSSSSSSSSKIVFEKKNRLFEMKNPLPYLIGNDLDNRWKQDTWIWLE